MYVFWGGLEVLARAYLFLKPTLFAQLLFKIFCQFFFAKHSTAQFYVSSFIKSNLKDPDVEVTTSLIRPLIVSEIVTHFEFKLSGLANVIMWS